MFVYICELILGAVRHCFQEASESEIIFYIKLWLVRAKDRCNNENKKKVTGNQDQAQEVDKEDGADVSS